MNTEKLDRLKIYNRLRKFAYEIKYNHLDVYSAGTAFYIFISIIPFFIALFLFVPFTPISRQDIIRLTNMLPSDFSIFMQVITAEAYVRNTTKLWVALVIAIWSAARGIMYMTKGLNEVYNVSERRNYFVLRLWAALYTLFILGAIVILLVMGVFGKRIMAFINSHIPNLPQETGSWVSRVLDFHILITLICLFLLFVFLYTVLPNKKLNWLYQTPGAACCSVLWWLFTKLFSFAVDRFGGFSMYGSMATAIATMLWLYCCMYILFLCSEINYHFAQMIINHIRDRQKKKQITDP